MQINLQELDGYVDYCLLGNGNYLLSKSITSRGKEVFNKAIMILFKSRPNRECRCKWENAANV